MTCFYVDSDIIKSIHRHQRCKKHIEKPIMHLLHCKSILSQRNHVLSSQFALVSIRPIITISAFFSFLFFFFLLCMIDQERYDLKKISLRRRVKRTR